MIGFGGGGRPFPNPKARHIQAIQVRIGERLNVGGFQARMERKNATGTHCVVRLISDGSRMEVPHSRRVTIRGRNQR